MNAPLHPTSAEAFDAKYRSHPDPWNFAASAYERGRYAATVAALRRPTYATAYEPGCSVGELTAELARRCSRLIATDLSPTAIARARQRCRHFSNVVFHVATHPTEVPVESLDLIVFSEIGYYFEAPMLGSFARRLAAKLNAGGEFIAVHWLGHSVDHALHGDAVHQRLKHALPLAWLGGRRHPGFRIDSWIRS